MSNLTFQVAQNNGFQTTATFNKVMQLLGSQIKHVIYVVKENRTYDQVLGDLEIGNGDPSIVVFPEPTTPNHHILARQFVTLDNFYDSGEVSGDGWNWTTQARTTDSIEKTEPVNYAGRAFTYDWEGINRNINVGYATVAERQAANPVTPSERSRSASGKGRYRGGGRSRGRGWRRLPMGCRAARRTHRTKLRILLRLDPLLPAVV